MAKYAPQITIYLSEKAKNFMRAFFVDIGGIPKKESEDDWTQNDQAKNGWYWSRVEYTETRGV
jgi:hypothetical protein